jgi:hypothetical protein
VHNNDLSYLIIFTITMATNLVSTFSLDKLHTLTKPNLQTILKEIGVSVHPKDKAHALRNILTREWPAFQTRQNPRRSSRSSKPKALPKPTPKTKPSQGQSNKRTRRNDDESDSSKMSDDGEETDTDDETVDDEINDPPTDDPRKTNAQEKRRPKSKRNKPSDGDSDELVLSGMWTGPPTTTPSPAALSGAEDAFLLSDRRIAKALGSNAYLQDLVKMTVAEMVGLLPLLSYILFSRADNLYIYHLDQSFPDEKVASFTLRTPNFHKGAPGDELVLPAHTTVWALKPPAIMRFQALARQQNNEFYFNEEGVINLETNDKEAADAPLATRDRVEGGQFPPPPSMDYLAMLQLAHPASKSRTPAGRGLSQPTAASFSAHPKDVLTTGIDVVYPRVTHIVAQYTTRGIWGKLGHMQIQPAHLLSLVTSWGAVPLPYFASLEDKYDLATTRARVLTFAANTDTQVDSSIPVDLDIIGSNVHSFENALRNYGHTLSCLFDLKPDIAQALRKVFDRTVEFLTPRLKGPHSSQTKDMLSYMGSYVQQEMAFFYARILATRNELASTVLTQSLESLPDLTPHSQLTIDIMSIAVRADTKPVHPKPDIQKSKKNKRDTTAKASTSHTSSAPQAQPRPVQSTPAPVSPSSALCGWYLSDRGCSKSPCSHPHRAPTTADADEVRKFFAFRKNLKQVIFT